MEVSTEIGSFLQMGVGDYKQIITLLKESGFTAYDFSMAWEGPSSVLINADDYKEQAIELRKYADSIGMKCNQTHAPLTRERLDEYEYGEAGETLLCRAIEISGILGATVCVVHQLKLVSPEENAAFFKRLEPLARTANVKIALENLWSWDNEKNCAKVVACSGHEDFRRHLDLLPADVFVGCVDTSHAGMKGLDTSPVQIIDALGERLGAMHLSDSDYRFDRHWLPFTMHYNFEDIIQALKRNGYKGDITFETDKFVYRFPVELLPALMRQMAAIGHYFKNRLEE